MTARLPSQLRSTDGVLSAVRSDARNFGSSHSRRSAQLPHSASGSLTPNCPSLAPSLIVEVLGTEQKRQACEHPTAMLNAQQERLLYTKAFGWMRAGEGQKSTGSPRGTGASVALSHGHATPSRIPVILGSSSALKLD